MAKASAVNFICELRPYPRRYFNFIWMSIGNDLKTETKSKILESRSVERNNTGKHQKEILLICTDLSPQNIRVIEEPSIKKNNCTTRTPFYGVGAEEI